MKYGLIGHPVGHSFSKEVHGLLGNQDYEIVDVLPEDCKEFLQKRDFIGVNVTLPHKETVLNYLDKIDPLAQKIGAVNTILNRNEHLEGYNTDYYGFRDLLLRNCNGSLHGLKVLILGTGGTSKTVLQVVKDLGAKEVYRVSRSKTEPGILSYAQAADVQAEVLINTTPVGMYPGVKEHCLPPQMRESFYAHAQICMDVIYRPLETPFIKEAKRRGIKAEGGLYMLVAQAVYSSELFLGKKYPPSTVDAVYRKMKEAIPEGEQPGDILTIDKCCLHGEIKPPPSKSYSHRHLIIAALCQGTSKLENVGKSTDICATIQALRKLGVGIQVLEETEDSMTLLVNGENFLRCNLDGLEEIDCKESGSTLRFLLPLALTTGERITFLGKGKLMERPMTIYEDICREQKLYYEKCGQQLTVQGRLCAGDYRIPGDVSSQFVTGLLLTLPFLQGDSRIILLPPVESYPYICMTLSALKSWGIKTYTEENTIYIHGGQQVVPGNVKIEADYSNGAYLAAYEVMGHLTRVTDLQEETLQGDCIFREIFQRLKSEEQPEFFMGDTPDLVPVAMAVAAYYHGAIFTGTRRLAFKESNRGQVMLEELKKFGIEGKMETNSITLFPGKLQKPKVPVRGHNDHRIVMALTLLLSVTGGCIEGYEAVNKSYPAYFSNLEKHGFICYKEKDR